MRTFNLKPHKHTRKDYDFHKSFELGAIQTPQFPDQLFFLSNILTQDVQDCTAFAACAVRASMTNKTYDPYAFWRDELSFAALSDSDGFDLLVPLATAVKTGFVSQPIPDHVDKPSAYFWVHADNGLDLFDSIRAAILTNNAPILAGLFWWKEWDTAQNGIILQNTSNTPLGGHCVKIAGWKELNGQPYLIIQNSWGQSFGDNGLFYFSRELSNKVFGTYGIGFWSDSANVTVKTLGFLSALYANLITLLQTAARFAGFHE